MSPAAQARRMLAAAAVLAALAGPWGAAPVRAAGERIVLDQVKIAVDNQAVTRRELDELRALQRREISSRLEGEALQQALEKADERLIQDMTEDLLIQSYAERQGIEISDEAIEERVDSILRREPRMADLYTDEQLKRFVLRDLLRRRVIAQEVDARVTVSEADIAAYCRQQSVENREVDVGHILIRGDDQAALERIREVRRELDAGADFEQTALRVSEDPSVQNNRGRLGYISRGQFVKPFEDKAFSLKVGELSEPVETQFGYHVIKVFDERSKGAQDCDNLEDVTRQSYRNQVYAQEREKKLAQFLADLREQAQVRVFD